MTQIGPGGLDAPASVDGVPYDIWEAIQARAYTWRGREPYRARFGLGLVDGLRDPGPTREQWRSRLRASLADVTVPGLSLRTVRVDVRGGRVRLEVDLDG